MMSFKLTLGVLFTLLAVAIIILGAISYRNNEASNRTELLAKNTHKVLQLAEEISYLSDEVQLESNAVFITKNPEDIRSYQLSRDSLLLKFNRLKHDASHYSTQLPRIDSLEILLADLIQATDSVLLESHQKGYSENRLLQRIARNKSFRQAIRTVVDKFKGEEQRLLLNAEKATASSIKAFNTAFFSMLSAVFVLLLTTFFSIRFNFNKRIKAQRELKKANELFGKLFNESPIGLLITDVKTGVIVDCNSAFSELVNYSRAEMIGKTATMLNILESEEQRNAIVKDAEDTGKINDLELQLKPKDKDPIWVSLSIQTIQTQNQQCFLSAILDMTVHKRAEEEIRKALEAEIELNKLKSNFVAMASHEFRTPLTTILSSSFLLENYSYGENQQKASKHVARIKSSVNNLTSILDEFLSLTKIEEGKIEPRLERINLKEYLNNVCVNLKSFAKPGQHIVYQHNGGDEVYSDPVLLANIVNNLVSNAIKYSPENTDIYISSAVNSRIHLKVKDSGIGIPDEDQKHLFERFYRASNAGTTQGTGLGLHIMKHYVEMLNGSIQVKSAIGKGTEFNIVFEPGTSKHP